MQHKAITSTQNALIKQIVVLKEKSRERKKTGCFVIEGQRELSLAIKANYQIKSVLFYSELISEEQVSSIIPADTELIEISKDVFQKLAHRDTTEGVIAIANSKSHDINTIRFSSENPLILVAEAPEKPGNIGAILRTADAAHVDAVIIANPKGDLYNPNIIRSSVGCVFTNQIGLGSTNDIISFLKEHNISMYCAALQASVAYHTQDYTSPTAIIVGTEATGLSDAWIMSATQNIIIPMQGEIDSMNVSVAAGILIFEAKRQRNFK
ncbi:RNA methyltransferase, TrmH family [Formosa sp. Hel1_31_208]|uniref:TrmH family RNA methyltransferase n=1 Tax=Formosa sp. Hel1_31_208 TaxID=1798225 RepID=UPI000879D580|nr:RNA methyltransferase [Formosa sp. Hel1_31_208]SDS30506.1 RNA methyltransferase, TrmH family [Formosa sp. Hel1_31_208]